jgi:hypothetical protein
LVKKPRFWFFFLFFFFFFVGFQATQTMSLVPAKLTVAALKEELTKRGVDIKVRLVWVQYTIIDKR